MNLLILNMVYKMLIKPGILYLNQENLNVHQLSKVEVF